MASAVSVTQANQSLNHQRKDVGNPRDSDDSGNYSMDDQVRSLRKGQFGDENSLNAEQPDSGIQASLPPPDLTTQHHPTYSSLGSKASNKEITPEVEGITTSPQYDMRENERRREEMLVYNSQTSVQIQAQPSTSPPHLVKEFEQVIRLSEAKTWSFGQMLLTFLHCVIPAYTASRLAKSGFIYLPTEAGGKYACPHCRLEIGDFSDGSTVQPETFHQMKSPDCPFSKNEFIQNPVSVMTLSGDQVDQSSTVTNVEMDVDSVVVSDDVDIGRVLETSVNQGASANLDHDSSLFTTTPAAAVVSNSWEETNPSPVEIYGSLAKRKDQNVLESVAKELEAHDLNLPHIKKQRMLAEKYRRRTFKQYHLLDTPITKRFAAHGLYLKESGGGGLELHCAWCMLIRDFESSLASDKQEAEKLLTEHVLVYQCPFIRGKEEDFPNVPYLFDDPCWKKLTKESSHVDTEMNGNLTNIGVNNQRAKYPPMAVKERRQSSFLTYPPNSTQPIDGLAEAGYFFASGKDYSVTCFMCGVVSSDWSVSDTPWVRHTRQSSTCQFVLSQKGHSYVQSTLEQHGTYKVTRKEDRINNVSTRMLRPRMDCDVITRALKFELPRDKIKTCVSKRIKSGEQDYMLLEELVREVQELTVPASRWSESDSYIFPDVIREPTLDEPSQEIRTTERAELQTTTLLSSSASIAAGVETTVSADRQQEIDRQAILDFGKDIDVSQLKSQLTCKVCLADLIGIIFIPCGHLVCCTSCAAAMTLCPICRKDVNGTIKANFR